MNCSCTVHGCFRNDTFKFIAAEKSTNYNPSSFLSNSDFGGTQNDVAVIILLAFTLI